jgi:hypothetical protein
MRPLASRILPKSFKTSFSIPESNKTAEVFQPNIGVGLESETNLGLGWKGDEKKVGLRQGSIHDKEMAVWEELSRGEREDTDRRNRLKESVDLKIF